MKLATLLDIISQQR